MICVMSSECPQYRHTYTSLLQSIVEYQGINHGKAFDNDLTMNDIQIYSIAMHIKTYPYIGILRIILGLCQ